jgi:group I intron endonuclease
MPSIVYRIVHIESGKTYIGSSALGTKRWKSHRHMLRTGRHHSPHLQHSWAKHGEAAFRFEVIETVESEAALLAREQHWIDTLRPEFNVAPVTGTRAGVPQPPSVAETLRKVHAGKPKSAEHRAKIGAAHRGRTWSPEKRAKASERVKKWFAENRHSMQRVGRPPGSPGTFTGKTHSEETKAKIRAAALARLERNPEEIERLRAMAPVAAQAAKAKGKTVSAETRAKISAANKGRKRTPEQVAAHVARTRGRKHSEESRERRRAWWAENRERMQEIHRARHAARRASEPEPSQP